jgi:hypothetical protein
MPVLGMPSRVRDTGYCLTWKPGHICQKWEANIMNGYGQALERGRRRLRPLDTSPSRCWGRRACDDPIRAESGRRRRRHLRTGPRIGFFVLSSRPLTLAAQAWRRRGRLGFRAPSATMPQTRYGNCDLSFSFSRFRPSPKRARFVLRLFPVSFDPPPPPLMFRAIPQGRGNPPEDQGASCAPRARAGVPHWKCASHACLLPLGTWRT